MNKANQSLEKHLSWFRAVLDASINRHFGEAETEAPLARPEAPALDEVTPLDRLFAELNLNWEEKVVVLLALIPHLRPQMLDIFLSNNPNLNSPFTEFGGVKGNTQNGFLPTKETALFLIAGDDLQKRIEVIKILQAHHPLYRRQILEVRAPEAGASSLSSPLTISKIALPKILWGGSYIPEFAADFPAKKVVSPLDWEDLVLAPFVMEQILEIKAWLKHESLIQEQWALKKILKPGFRSLFFGPPGTGKTLTASLLGKTLAMDVYRIDLAMVVSKYIGDTEKNLARVFDLAENNQWILFFDEADALFGKRSLTKSSNDRYANQEVSYLLQRIEDFPGLVILASNFKGNLDDAFIRRFQSIIHFPLPGPEQRLALWQKAFSQGLQLGVEVNLEEIAREHEVSGGEIINVLRYVAIKTAEQGAPFVDRETIIQGLNREFQKNGRALGL